METVTSTNPEATRRGPARGCCAPPLGGALSEEATAAAVARFKALADPARLGIVALLAANAEPICVCDINDGFDLAQPTISHHLRVLREAGLVTSERRGSWAFYGLHPMAAEWVRETLAALPR